MAKHEKTINDAFRISFANTDYYRERISAELRFARFLCAQRPEDAAEWRPLIDRAEQAVVAAASGGVDTLRRAVAEAEAELAPIAGVSKTYTVYCIGHAHIDMNWMWSWPETVGVTIDSFTTVLKLLEEFPQFVFSQSQASVYRILEKERPDLLARIAERVREGRWEVTASHWVEGDKNIASAESLCRHLLYTRRYMQDLFGLAPEDVEIDWSPDTFGHAHTVPSYLARGGVKYYYHHRPGVHGANPRHGAFWWQGPDGSRVLARNDMALGYNGQIGPHILWRSLIPFVEGTGLPFTMFVYGVGDHGGGPTRRDLLLGLDMMQWPVFPEIRFDTARTFFRRLEREGDELPVLDCELNFEFSGCYTTQTLIKKANRYGEKRLLDAEVAALLGQSLGGEAYPRDRLTAAWRDTLFNHFHDILPGSGVHDTRTYTHGLYQQTMATTAAVESGALRFIAGLVDTSAAGGSLDAGLPPSAASTSLGAGAGRGSRDGGQSEYEFRGHGDHRAVVLFNTIPYERSEIVESTVWDPGSWEGEESPARFELSGPDGTTRAAQIVDRGKYWGHAYVRIAFPAVVPALGYAAYVVSEVHEADPADGGLNGAPGAAEPAPAEAGSAQTAAAGAAAAGDSPPAVSASQIGYGHPCNYAQYERGPEGLENDLVRVELDPISGGIASFLDKSTGTELIRARGAAPSLLRYAVERARPMSAWEIEHTGREEEPVVRRIKRVLDGPYKAGIEVAFAIEQSEFVLTCELRCGDPTLYLHLTGTWFQRGGKETGTPVLRLAVPCALQDQRPLYEIPFGGVTRDLTHGEEVPALRWAAVGGTSGGSDRGLALFNDSKHGHAHLDGVLYLTLIRASYEPDPLPEIGEHEVHLGIRPLAAWPEVTELTARAREFEHGIRSVSTDAHAGSLPRSASLIGFRSDRAVLNAVKPAENGDGIIVRLYNPTDEADTVELRFNADLLGAVAGVEEVDLLERAVVSASAALSASGSDGTITATIPPRGIVSARVSLTGR